MSEAHNASIVRSEFGAEQLQVQHETAATAVAAAEKAAIEARHILAKKFPRDLDTVLVRLKKECERPGFADAAIYSKPVGKERNKQTGEWEDKFVEGLSVRFAEAAVRHMGNVYVSAKVIYNDDRMVIKRVTAMDLETNTTYDDDAVISKTVERRNLKKGQQAISRRINSYGDEVFKVEATDDDVLNKTNAQVAKARRNSVLCLIPGDIQDECERLCRATQAKRDKADPDAAKRALFDSFAAIGVMPDAIKAFLGTTAENLEPAELLKLRAIYAAIRDSETTWKEVVESKEWVAQEANPGAVPASTLAPSKVDDLVRKHREKIAAKNGGARPEPGPSGGAPAGKPDVAKGGGDPTAKAGAGPSGAPPGRQLGTDAKPGQRVDGTTGEVSSDGEPPANVQLVGQREPGAEG